MEYGPHSKLIIWSFGTGGCDTIFMGPALLGCSSSWVVKETHHERNTLAVNADFLLKMILAGLSADYLSSAFSESLARGKGWRPGNEA